jgi:Icc-related predicted phosphoesterase
MISRRILSYVSDIHLERKINIPKIKTNNKNLLVLCGDITNFTNENYNKNFDFFNNLSQSFRKILYVPGNHEYDSSIYEPQKITKYKPIIKDFISQFPNIKLLDNDYYEEGNTIFLGTTLWSKAFISNVDKKLYEKYYENSEYQRMEYNKNYEWLRENIERNRKKDIIVLTHYSPTSLLMEENYRKKGKDYISWYSNNLEEIMENNIKYWICGHIHNVKEIKINNTLCCVNAIGKNDSVILKNLEY